MAKLPAYLEIEPVGIDEDGYALFKIKCKKWGIPFLFLWGLMHPLRFLRPLPESCDGVKVTDTEFV